MRFSVDPQIFTTFDNPRIAVTFAEGVQSDSILSMSHLRLGALASDIREEYSGSVVTQLPKIAAWRTAYQAFGAKPREYPSSVEALYRRTLQGKPIAGNLPIVDIYNYISLKHMLPVGAEDTDNIVGDLRLTYATAYEKPVKVLGRDEEQPPQQGEVIYADDEGAVCRRWNWREVARTALSSETSNCVLVLEALNPVTDNELRNAQQELGNLVETYCGGRLTHFVLDQTNTSIIF